MLHHNRDLHAVYCVPCAGGMLGGAGCSLREQASYTPGLGFRVCRRSLGRGLGL